MENRDSYCGDPASPSQGDPWAWQLPMAVHSFAVRYSVAQNYAALLCNRFLLVLKVPKETGRAIDKATRPCSSDIAGLSAWRLRPHATRAERGAARAERRNVDISIATCPIWLASPEPGAALSKEYPIVAIEFQTFIAGQCATTHNGAAGHPLRSFNVADSPVAVAD